MSIANARDGMNSADHDESGHSACRKLCRQTFWRLALTVVWLLGFAIVASAAQDTVFVESKYVNHGAKGVTIGIRIANRTAPLSGLTVPLVIRQNNAGAFIDSLAISYGGRLISDTTLNDSSVTGQYALPNGTCKPGGFGTITSGSGLKHAVSGSPEGVLFRRVNNGTSRNLSLGSDNTGSLILTVDVTDTAGSFDIDTTCTDPANHLLFATAGGDDVVPKFVKGVITILDSCPVNNGTSAAVSGVVGSQVSNQVKARDPENDLISYFIVSGSKGSVDSTTGLWSYTPTCADLSGFNVSIKASDKGESGCPASVITFHVNVTSTDLTVTGCGPATVHWGATASRNIGAGVSGGCPPYTYLKITGPGSVAAGVWSYPTHCADVGTPDTVEVQVTDSNGKQDTCDFGLTVTDTTPVARDTSAIMDEDPTQPVALQMQAYDPDDDPLTFQKDSGPSHGVFANFASTFGAFTYSPFSNYYGPDTITFKVSDGCKESASRTIAITVNPVNDPPVAFNDGPYNTDEDTPRNVAVPGVLGNDTDAENDPLTAVRVDSTAHGVLAFNANGSFTYSPNSNYHGPDGFTYRAKDAQLLSNNIATVSITVNQVNDKPVARDTSWVTDEDTPNPAYLPAKDTGDADQTLTYTIISGPVHGTVTSGPAPGTGALTYTPASNYHGMDSLKFEVRDNGSPVMYDTGGVTITVNQVNDKPVARDTSWATSEDTPNSTYLPAKDTGDVDQALTYAIISGPVHGDTSLVVPRTGAFTYTPKKDYNGLDSLKFRVCDDGLPASLCDTATVLIRVTFVNDPPTTPDTSLSMAKSALSIDIDVLAHASDPDTYYDPTNRIDSSTVTIKNKQYIAGDVDTAQTYAYTTGAKKGQIHFTPKSTYAGGSITLTYTVKDTYAPPEESYPPALVVVTVNALPNNPPVARDTLWSTGEDTAKSVAFLPWSHVDVGQTLTFSITAGPLHGGTSAFNAGTGAFTYTPTANYCGSDSLTFQVCDNGGPPLCSSTAKTRITVNCVNDAPVARDTSWSTNEDVAKLVAFLPWSHVDVGQTLTFSITAGPLHGGTSGFNAATGAYAYTPAANYCGADSLTFKVCDNGVPSLCATAKARITVTCVNDAPVARDTSWTTGEGTAKSVAFLPCSHVDMGQTLTFSITAGPPNGRTSGFNTGTGAFTYTPTANYWGADSLTFQVCDNGIPLLCTTARVRITVTPPAVSFTSNTLDFGIRNADCSSDPGDLSATAKLTITNRGSAALGISNLLATPAADPEFVIADRAGVVIDAGRSDSFEVMYCPKNVGSDTGNVIVAYTAGGKPGTDTLVDVLGGQADSARINVPPILQFPAGLQVGGTYELPFLIDNLSGVTLRIDSLALENKASFTASPQRIIVPPYDSRPCTLVFIPPIGQPGRYDSKMFTYSNARTSPVTTEIIAQAKQRIWFVQERADLRRVPVCGSAGGTFTLLNLSIDTLVIERFRDFDIGHLTISGDIGKKISPEKGIGQFTLTYSPGADDTSRTVFPTWDFHTVSKPDTRENTSDAVASVGAVAALYRKTTPDSVTIDTIEDSAATYQIHVQDSGNAVLRLSPCSLQGETSIFHTTSNCTADLSPGSGANIVVTASSRSAGSFDAQLILPSNGFAGHCVGGIADSITDTVHLRLNVRDTRPPVIVPPTDSSVLQGGSDILAGAVSDDTGVDSVIAGLRRLDAPASAHDLLVSGTLTPDGDGQWKYRVEVPDSFVDGLGYEYMLEASDRHLRSSTGWLRRDVGYKAGIFQRPSIDPLTALKEDGSWYLIAAPGRPDTATLDVVLRRGAGLDSLTGGYDTDDWRVYEVNSNGTAPPGNVRSLSDETLKPGTACWFRHRGSSTVPVVWSLPAGSTRPGLGSGASVFEVSLRQGWTLFSNPFFVDAYVRKTELDALVSTLLQGNKDGYPNDGNAADSGNSLDTDYVRFEDTTYARFRPWVGYAAYSATGGGILKLTPHPPSPPSLARRVPPRVADGFRVTFGLSSGGRLVGRVVCGSDSRASDDWDYSDIPLLPVPQAAGAFYVPHDDWGALPRRYVVDQRSSSGVGMIYPLGWSTTESGNRELRLTVEAVDRVPAGQIAVLYDRATDKRIELGAGTSYTFRSELSRDDNRFVVLIGDASFTEQWTKQEQSGRPVTYDLAPNYPNPFNAGTVIGFTLPQYTHVSLEVYNILGQRVRTLADHPMYPGVYQIEFDGTDNAGRGLATGVYFYRLSSPLGTSTRKMVLMK